MSIDDAIFDMGEEIKAVSEPAGTRLQAYYSELVDHIADLEREQMESEGAVLVNREAEFKDAFCAAFTASYAARRYDSACMSGEHGVLEQVLQDIGEDAEILAEAAWKGRAN